MKAYHIDGFGSIGGIVRRSAEDPRPGPKEVLMRVRASSLNYRDLMVLKVAVAVRPRLASYRFRMVPAMLKPSARGLRGSRSVP